MLGIWFFLERWFTDIPSFRAIYSCALATMLVLVLTVMPIGLGTGLSSHVGAMLLTVGCLAVAVWAVWAFNRVLSRH